MIKRTFVNSYDLGRMTPTDAVNKTLTDNCINSDDVININTHYNSDQTIIEIWHRRAKDI